MNASKIKPGNLGTPNNTILGHFQVNSSCKISSKRRCTMKFTKMFLLMLKIANMLDLTSEWDIQHYKHFTWPKLSKEFKSEV